MNKKTIIISMVLVCIFLLSACNKKNDEPPVTISDTFEISVSEDAVPTGTPDNAENVEDWENLPNVELVPEEDEDSAATISPSPTESTREEPNVPPAATQAPSNKNDNNSDNSSDSNSDETDSDICCEYARYLAMSPADQESYMNSFSSTLEFITWSKSAQAEHDAHTVIESVEGDVIDISQFINQ